MKYAMCMAGDYNLGAAYIVSYLKSQGHQVKIIFDPRLFIGGQDKPNLFSRLFDVEEHNLKQIKEFCPDVCLFSFVSAHYPWALKLAQQVKKRLNCKVIFGGVHAKAVPEVIRQVTFVDEVCEGEGIEFFGGKFDADKIFPERKDFHNILPARRRQTPIVMTSFGCPYECTFCLPRRFKMKMRRRSVDGCLRELALLKADGARYFDIVDDVFTSNKAWLYEFLERYKKEINLPFRCMTHPCTFDEERAQWLAQARCYWIGVGIQSGSEQHRREILNRHEKNSDIIKTCAAIKKYKMLVSIDHIMELPYESEQTIEESYRLYKRISPDLASVGYLLYFPKTQIIDHAIRQGILKESDRDKINRGEYPQYSRAEFNLPSNNRFLKRILIIPLRYRIFLLLPSEAVVLLIYLILYLKKRRQGAPNIIVDILRKYAYFMKRRFLC